MTNVYMNIYDAHCKIISTLAYAQNFSITKCWKIHFNQKKKYICMYNSIDINLKQAKIIYVNGDQNSAHHWRCGPGESFLRGCFGGSIDIPYLGLGSLHLSM